MRAERYWRRVEDALRQREAAELSVKDASFKLEDAEETLKEWSEAQRIVQEAAQAVQTEVHSQIAGVVTRCLRTVFGPKYTFHIEFERKRGKTEARMFFKKGEHEVDPTEESGLGVTDVAAFALRLACLKLHQPPVAPVLILDEPFRFVDSINSVRVAELLHILSEETGIQIVMITHNRDFVMGDVVEIG